MNPAPDLQAFLHRQWRKRGLWAWLWLPLGLLTCAAAWLKRQAYQRGWRRQSGVNVPVVVVGNLVVGGSGKSPLVAYIARLLRKQGYQPGILARGYRGKAKHWPQRVTPDSDPFLVGDEPVMLARQTGCPVMAGPDRVTAAKRLAAEGCDLIISDDGFQHLRLRRDIDILVYDATDQDPLGNGWCLPSGPLREPPGTGKYADISVFNGGRPSPGSAGDYAMSLIAGEPYALRFQQAPEPGMPVRQPLHAIAGIGRPARFFNTLREAGFTIIEHPFDDHHVYTVDDLRFDDRYDLITTEKDALKLASIETTRTIWVVPVQAQPEKQFDYDLLDLLAQSRKQA